MTVWELIVELSKHPPDTKVVDCFDSEVLVALETDVHVTHGCKVEDKLTRVVRIS